MVVDALSQKTSSIVSLAFLMVDERPLALEVSSLAH